MADSKSRFPDWGDFSARSGKYPPDSPGEQLEDLLRASLHNEVTASQSKFVLKEIYSKLNFQEQRAMREKWFANDFGRILAQEDSFFDQSEKCCECLLVHCQQASLLSVLFCPVLSIGYFCSFCKANKAAKLAQLAQAAEEQEYEADSWSEPFFEPLATAPLQQPLLEN